MANKDYLFVNPNVIPTITTVARFDNFVDDTNGRDNNNLMDLVPRRVEGGFLTADQINFRFNLMNHIPLGGNYTDAELQTLATDNSWQLWLDGTQLV